MKTQKYFLPDFYLNRLYKTLVENIFHILWEHNYQFVFFLIIIAPLLISCTTSKDIWNPNHQQKVMDSRSQIPQTSGKSKETEPDWLYAFNPGFIVGYAQGKTINEAKQAASRDIKTQIAKFLGEEVSIFENISTNNIITGRNSVVSQEVFQFDQYFKSKFEKPVINFDPQNVLDFYWTKSGATAKYFIKYKISPEEIEAIKIESGKRVRNLQNFIDSLLNIDILNTIDDLQLRYAELKYLHRSSSHIKFLDSLRINNAILSIERDLNNLEIKILTEEQGLIRFILQSYGKKLWYSIKPEVIPSTGINIDNISTQNGIWIINYSNPQNIKGDLYIFYDNSDFAIYSTIDINKTESPNVEGNKSSKDIYVEKASINCIDASIWDGDIQEIEIYVFINSNAFAEISSIELELISNDRGSKTFEFNNIMKIEKGTNRLTWGESCDLPRMFLRSVHRCNMQFSYSQSEDVQNKKFESIPVTIKNL